MAYPAADPVLSNQQSIDVIVESEASILQGLNQIYCQEFVTGLLNDLTMSAEDKLIVMGNVLNTMACKECTIANILESAAEFIAVDKDLVDQTGRVAFNCDYCCKK